MPGIGIEGEVEMIEETAVNTDTAAPAEAPEKIDLPIVRFWVGEEVTGDELKKNWEFECKRPDFSYDGKTCEKWVVGGDGGQIWLARDKEQNKLIGVLRLVKGEAAASVEELKKWHFTEGQEYNHGGEYYTNYELHNAEGRLLVNKNSGVIKSYTKNPDF
ncbi:MAG: hypothetical protein WC227_01305 [Patescibacteria group bacterium]|jgi:hypothetical protein